ncbi:MAG: hypothetical protein JO269_05565 [Burkholderiaceae bacterium]|nr:hypothetical protein [Burkholderiaceae bacterium]
MAQNALANQFMLNRSASDRRNAAFSEPPYMTEEGLVLIDRRDQVDRRGAGGLDSGHSDWFNAGPKTGA